jgi:integrase
MAGVRSKPHKGGKYQGWFIQADGRRKYFTGTHSRPDTLRMAQRLEDEHRQVRLGYRPPPSPANKHRSRPFAQVADEYLAWGEAQGGRGGRPWGPTHARNRRTHLERWQDRLGLQKLGDLIGVLPRVEKVLRDLKKERLAGKTLFNYAEALRAFCRWCVKRDYLSDDPLKGLERFDTTPKTIRRAMTTEEINQLLDVCAPHRRLLLETALQTGLRAKELASLTLKHLDLENGGLRLDAQWTKNRKDGFQPVPQDLLVRLKVFAESGQPALLYRRYYGRKDAQLKIPKQPLLYVPSHPSRELGRDLAKAGIPKETSEGKVDFHACRVAYITFVIESGVTVKEAQTLARHSTPELTMNIYARVREERLTAAVERVADAMRPVAERAIYVQQGEEDKNREGATPFVNRELRLLENGGGGGIRTRVRK